MQRSRTRRGCYWNDAVFAPVIPLLQTPHFSSHPLHIQRYRHGSLDPGHCDRVEPDVLVL